MHELSAQAQAAQAEAEALQGLQASLQDSAGPSVDALVEAAVGRERALQDARNRKLLQLLNSKVSVHCTSRCLIMSLHHNEGTMLNQLICVYQGIAWAPTHDCLFQSHNAFYVQKAFAGKLYIATCAV